MAKDSYTNAELLARVDERQKAIQEKLDMIYEQVTKTNGRVSALEAWRNQLNGGFRATTLIYSVLSSVLGAGVGVLTTYILK